MGSPLLWPVVTTIITSETNKIIAFDIITTMITTMITMMITMMTTMMITMMIAVVQVNGTSEERLLAQLSALQLAVSQGSTNTVMVFLQFLLIFILIYI